MASAERQEGWTPLDSVPRGTSVQDVSIKLIDAELDPNALASVDFETDGHDDAVYADC